MSLDLSGCGCSRPWLCCPSHFTGGSNWQIKLGSKGPRLPLATSRLEPFKAQEPGASKDCITDLHSIDSFLPNQKPRPQAKDPGPVNRPLSQKEGMHVSVCYLYSILGLVVCQEQSGYYNAMKFRMEIPLRPPRIRWSGDRPWVIATKTRAPYVC